MERTEKITVSLPKEHVRTVKRAVRREGGTVSGYIAAAIAAYEKADELEALLDELDRELGEPCEAARQWAQNVLR
jgi:hypothetical protein